MHWAQAILFCGGLIYAAVDDLRTRTVSDIVCIVIALAGRLTKTPPPRFWGAAFVCAYSKLVSTIFSTCSREGKST